MTPPDERPGPTERKRMEEALGIRHHITEAHSEIIPEPQAMRSARILLVEDQEVHPVAVRKFLESSGAMVEVAGNGRIGLERLSAEVFDLILMDCQMPEMDGFEATERIRSMEAGTDRHIPIIGMTVHAMAADRDRCMAVGMDDFLTKSISREALALLVAGWFAPRVENSFDSSPLSNPSGFPMPAPELDLDQDLFQKLWEVFDRNGKEMGVAVLEPFTRRGRELLENLRHSAVTGDAAGLKFSGHALKGSSRALALNALGRVAERLEKEGGSAPPEVLTAWLDEADQAFFIACRYLRTLAGG